MAKVAAYLERGKTYLVLDLDEALREVGRTVVQREEIPPTVADECDRFEPHHFREVSIPEDRLSHPKARDAAIHTFEHWSKLSATKEEAFDHAIAEYLLLRKITVQPEWNFFDNPDGPNAA